MFALQDLRTARGLYYFSTLLIAFWGWNQIEDTLASTFIAVGILMISFFLKRGIDNFTQSFEK